MKILEELWNGNILPSERNIGAGSKMQHLGELIIRHEKNLDPLLSEKAKELLEKLQDNQAEWAYLKECEIFTYGFRLGARIMLEVMDDGDKMTETKDPL